MDEGHFEEILFCNIILTIFALFSPVAKQRILLTDKIIGIVTVKAYLGTFSID